jgi:YHS domain-containing protein
MRSLIVALGLAFAALAPAAPALAEQAPVHTGLFSNVAVGGYDPVAYFTDGHPVRGSAQFKTTYQGFEYRFASAEHLAAFRANPTHYLPQYGGYCAWAVAQDRTAPGDPNYWRIVDGKLYLNYNAEIQHRWEANTSGFIRDANSHWPSVLSH